MITIERAEADEPTFREVADLLARAHDEVRLVEVNVEKAAAQIFAAMQDGMTFVARDENGVPVGSIALYESDVWMSDAIVLRDRWVMVARDARFGDVLTKLLKAAGAEGKKRGLPVFVTVLNPNRKQRVTEAGLYAQVVGFMPMGHTIKIG